MRRGMNTTNIYMPETIQENRAPTDDSIRLAEEYEAKVKSKIVDSIKVDDNVVSGEVMYIIPPYHVNTNDYLEVNVRFKLNGKDYTIKSKVKGLDYYGRVDYAKEQLYIEIFKQLIKDIMANFVKEVK